MRQPRFIIEEVTDPEAVAQRREQDGRARRNEAWLQAHWPELLPRARGRHIAVAGQEAFIADTPEEAWAMAIAAHPDDDGALLQYVIPHRGPRIYANRG
ncbi:MAG: hypothetical protein ACRDJE_16255 [Dehalococcoidia bacterium]